MKIEQFAAWAQTKKILRIPEHLAISSIMPISTPELIEADMKQEYERRFESIADEQEKELVAITEFYYANPRIAQGMKRYFTDFKRMGDISTGSLQVALGAYAYNNAPGAIGIPLAGLAGVGAITSTYNAMRTSGYDWSGLLSTVLNYLCLKVQKDV